MTPKSKKGGPYLVRKPSTRKARNTRVPKPKQNQISSRNTAHESKAGDAWFSSTILLWGSTLSKTTEFPGTPTRLMRGESGVKYVEVLWM